MGDRWIAPNSLEFSNTILLLVIIKYCTCVKICGVTPIIVITAVE